MPVQRADYLIKRVQWRVKLISNSQILKFCTLSPVDENQLRAMGYDKTPDIILEVPIGQYVHYIIHTVQAHIHGCLILKRIITIIQLLKGCFKAWSFLWMTWEGKTKKMSLPHLDLACLSSILPVFWIFLCFLFMKSCWRTHCPLDWEQSVLWRRLQSSHLSQWAVLELLEQVSRLF